MGWQDLISEQEIAVAAWLGGRDLYSGTRRWVIVGQLPREHGWYEFKTHGRRASYRRAAEQPGSLHGRALTGYLVGDRFVFDDARVDPDPDKIFAQSEQVYLVEGVDRFARVSVGRAWERGPLVLNQLEFPLGPETGVLEAYLARRLSVVGVRGVTPALDAAFRLESRQRLVVEERRAAIERERLAAEERRRVEGLVGTGSGRRELAASDFSAAAIAALKLSGAEYLDHVMQGRDQSQAVVRYRLQGRRFECVCDARTLRIVDAGICLRAGGEVGDTKFTLESLPAVVLDAQRLGVLHVFRHVDSYDDYDRDREDD